MEGTVQGVGFRPFVYSLASRLGLGGVVGNDVDGVFAEVEGAPGAVREFLLALEREAPPLARIERVTTREIVPNGCESFCIAPSEPAGARRTGVPADSATCADCLAELADPADRRFGYPFINCTNCGPRFTIVRDVPYDRPLTTMAGFTMCAACAAEYHDPADRRFHAQPTCCPACGPALWLAGADGSARPGDPLAGAAELIRRGGVLAVKGLGGYHLAVDASCQAAAAALRGRKHREDKPFAIMAADLTAARQLCEVDDTQAALLTGPRRPIVLLARRPDAPVADAVAPGNRQLGLILPYTPLHHLLLAAVGRPMVLTSGNVSDEPIAYRDGDALARLGPIADAFLGHDRAIHVRADDSVVRAWRGRQMLLRRSRGYAPEPIRVRSAFRRPVLACGAELKSTFCLAKENRAVLSQHIGDLENAETLRSFTEGIEHFRRLFDIEPQVVAHDLHPEYLCDEVRGGSGRRVRYRPGRRAAPPRAHRLLPGRQRRGRPGDRGGLRRDGVRHGRHHLGRRVPGGRPGGLRPRRAFPAGPDAGRRGGDQAAVADGRRLPRRGLPWGAARRPGRHRAQRSGRGRTWSGWPGAACMPP